MEWYEVLIIVVGLIATYIAICAVGVEIYGGF